MPHAALRQSAAASFPAGTARPMTGNEAIARGVWEAGARVAAAYPGTPSTEILETIATYPPQTSTPSGPPTRRPRWMSPSAPLSPGCAPSPRCSMSA